MKTKKILFAILVVLFSTTTAYAQFGDQDEMIELTQGQIQQIRIKGAEKTAQMNDYISFMADKHMEKNDRLENKKNALNLFLGKGYRYKEFGEYKDGVVMQITSKRTNSVVSIPYMRVYFQSLIDGLKTYTDVKISSTEVAGIKVSRLQRIGPNEWKCTCEYDQVFEGIRDGRLIYRDITTKYVECHIAAEQTELGTEFVVKLGDVYAKQTK